MSSLSVVVKRERKASTPRKYYAQWTFTSGLKLWMRRRKDVLRDGCQEGPGDDLRYRVFKTLIAVSIIISS
jgi:hypothetical protein